MFRVLEDRWGLRRLHRLGFLNAAGAHGGEKKRKAWGKEKVKKKILLKQQKKTNVWIHSYELQNTAGT